MNKSKSSIRAVTLGIYDSFSVCGQLGPARAVPAGRPGRAHRCHWVLMTARTLGSQEGLTDDTCMVAGYASFSECCF